MSQYLRHIRGAHVEFIRRKAQKHITNNIFAISIRHASTLPTAAEQPLTVVREMRNIGIIAHIDAGKTTTTERMLYYSGFTRRIGDVDDGSTVTDFLPAERARGITIQSAAITFHWPPQSPESTRLTLSPLPRSLTPHTINLIDTPGHADFTFEVLRSLRILDGAVCILDAVAGVEAQTEKVWHQASRYEIPRIIFVNKLDRDGAAFGKTVREIGSRLAAWPAVCQIPWFEDVGDRFIGVGDVVGLCGMRWTDGGDGKTVTLQPLAELDKVDPSLAEEIRRARIALVELLSEHDDLMVELFLQHDEDHLAIPASEIKECLRRCLLAGSTNIIPVFAGASLKNIGVQPLLDAIVDLLPAPEERPDPNITLGRTEGRLEDLLSGKMTLASSADHERQNQKRALITHAKPNLALVQALGSCALAFKVVNDPKRGILVYVRVYSGTLNKNALLFNTNLQVAERCPRILKMYASDAVEISAIPSGQIGVLVGLKYARTGDTVITYQGMNPKNGPPTPLNSLQLRPIEVPPPVFFASVEPASPSDGKHLKECLDILLREDPSLHINVDEESGQTLLSGMGELHLEIARDRLLNDFRAKAEMGPIEIGYRETVLEAAGPIHSLFDREVAGKKSKAGCSAAVAPLLGASDEIAMISEQSAEAIRIVTSDGNRIISKIPALLDPEHLPLPPHLDSAIIHQALIQGALAALSRGPRHFFPLHSISVELSFDLESDNHGATTTSTAIMNAARVATRAALSNSASSTPSTSGSTLMEPVMTVLINVDEASLGAVVHDLSSARSAHVLSLSSDEDAISDVASSVIPANKIYAPPDLFSADTSTATSAAHNRHRTIKARVPLREMVGYLKHLRSLTGGRGTFVMSVDRFERVEKRREKAILTALRAF